MASPTVSVENNSKRIRCVALDQCNLIVAEKFRRESRPLICPPVLCRVDNLALASPRCGSALVKTVRVIHVPRIIAGRAEERTGGPFEKQAVSLKLIHRVSRPLTVNSVIVEYGHAASYAADAAHAAPWEMEVVIVNLPCSAPVPSTILRAVALHLRAIHVVVPPHPTCASKVVRSAGRKFVISLRWMNVIILNKPKVRTSEVGRSSKCAIAVAASSIWPSVSVINRIALTGIFDHDMICNAAY